MRKTAILLYSLLLTVLSVLNVNAQDKQKARVSLMKQTGNTVAITINSSGEFYIGGNTHVLYIGNKYFSLHDQDNIDGKGMLKFYIPASEFKALKTGTKMYVSYGELDLHDEQTLDALSKDPEARCWTLGKLNKKMLK